MTQTIIEPENLNELLPDIGYNDEDRAYRETVVRSMARTIEDHAYGHQISNSPYGHSCPSECLASSILLMMRNDAVRRLNAPPGCLIDPACKNGQHSIACVDTNPEFDLTKP